MVHTDGQAEEGEVAKDDGPRAGSTGKQRCRQGRINLVKSKSDIPVCFSVAIDSPDQKQLGEERVYLSL